MSKNNIWNVWGLFKKDIQKRDLKQRIGQELEKLGSALVPAKGNYIKHKNRSSQFWETPHPGQTGVDFWENGMYWHSQHFKDISQAAHAIYLWNEVRLNSPEIEKLISEAAFTDKRKMIEASNEEYIKWHWQQMLNNKHNTKNETELIKLLAEDEVTGKLMMFRQLWDIGLSRYVGEYGESLKNDLLRARVSDEGYIICSEEQANFDKNPGLKDYLGKSASAVETFTVIKNNLPENLGWAAYQTLEEYSKRIRNEG